MHLDFGIVGGFSTVVEGQKVFLSWPPTDKNFELFHAHHHFSNLWDTVFETAKKMEGIKTNHITTGTTIYLPASILHMVLTPVLSFLHGVYVVSPTIEE